MKISQSKNYRDDYHVQYDGGEAADEMRNKYKDDMENFQVQHDGLNRSRCCTDIFCLLLFWAFIGAMTYATVYGYQNGAVHKLTAPIDADLNFCGFGEMEGYPKMILTNFKLTSGAYILKSGVCITECPKEGGTEFKNGVNCKSNSNAKCSSKKSYKTYDAFDFCLPLNREALSAEEQVGYDYLMKQLWESPVGSVFEDIYRSSVSIQICMGLAFVWSFIFIYLMSCFAETLAWCCVILIQIGLLAATIFSGLTWNKERLQLEELRKERHYDDMTEDEKKKFDDEEGWTVIYFMILLVTMAILCCCFFTALCCARKSLSRAIDVVDASADYIAGNKCVILIPNFHYILLIAFNIIWLGAFLCVISLNEIKADKYIPQNRDLVWDKNVTYAALFMFFGYLWITAWIEYTSRFVVIMSAATYYFNNRYDKPEEDAPADFGYSFKCAYFHHMGSLAFGAVIIAIIRFIKYMFYNFAKKLQKMHGDNRCVQCFVACGTCILNCIERICDYLNEAAYCYMAVTGDHFLSSAWSGFLLNLKHGLAFFFANSIAKVFIFIGKIGIVVANCFSLYFLIQFRQDPDDFSGMWAPMIVVAIMTYFAASLFLSLLEEAIMALMTCLYYDIDANGGKPMYGPATFHNNTVPKIKTVSGEVDVEPEENSTALN